MEKKYVTIKFGSEKIRLFYGCQGNGKRLLLIHGWGHSSKIWTALTKRLCSTSKVVTIDLPGFGCSPALKSNMIDIRQYGKILLKFISEIFGDSMPSVVVADSLGAIIVLRLMAKGHLISNRVLLSGCPFEGLPKILGVFKIKGLLSWFFRVIQFLPKDFSSAILRLVSLYTVHKQKSIESSIIGALMADPRTAERLFQQMMNSKISLDKKTLRRPRLRTIVVRGEKDRVVSRDTSLRLARILKADYVEISGVGHTPMIEDVAAYHDALDPLLV